MKHQPRQRKVSGAQFLSEHCFVCGVNNSMSLQARFFNLADGDICALFTAKKEHQGYPGRAHGGIISAILDETIARAIQVKYPEIFGVTIELNVKFRKPVPIGEELKVLARLDTHNKRVFEGTGEVLLADGTVAAQASAIFLHMETDTLVNGKFDDSYLIVDEGPIPQIIEI